MKTNVMLKKFALICVYIIVNYQCSVNAAILKRENYDSNKILNLKLPIYQKITGDTLRKYPILGYKIKKCLSHYYKNLKKPEKYVEDSEEIGRFPKKDSYIVQQNANSPREESLSVIKKPNKHDSNLTSQFLKVPKEKHVDNKSEKMELNELTSNSSAENLFNAIIIGEQTTIESEEDHELYDGIIVGESEEEEEEEEDSETTFQPIMKYSEKVKSDRRMGQFDSGTQPEEITYNITVFADENNENKMVAHVIEKLLLEIDLDDFMEIIINYMRTHNDELTFNKFNEILSNRKGNGTKLPYISDELRRKLSELGNTPLPYIYFDIDEDMSFEYTEEINEYHMN